MKIKRGDIYQIKLYLEPKKFLIIIEETMELCHLPG